MLLTSGWGPGYPEIWHAADLSIEERLQRHGRGDYTPVRPLIAGEYVTITFHFEIGTEEVVSGGQLGIVWRWPFDWADLQTEDSAQDGYMVVSAVNRSDRSLEEVTLEATYHRFKGVEPWHHSIVLQVREGHLIRGDQISLICGDQTGGGRGWRVPTCKATSAGFLMLIDHTGSGRWVRLPDPPGFSILPGPPSRLVAIAPADAVIGETVDIRVRAEDQWGNPTPIPDRVPHLTVISSDGSSAQKENPPSAPFFDTLEVSTEPAVYRFSAQFHQVGSYRIMASVPETELLTESNPILVYPARPQLRLFWGDLHSGQSEIGCGIGTLQEHYTYAREVAGLQFTTHQANDHYVTRSEWQHLREQASAFYVPGRFVTFLGCEWSPPTKDGGDRNVFYRHDEPRLRRSGRFFTETEPDPELDIPTAPDFHKALEGQEVLVNLHVGGRPTNLDYYAPAIERLAEIHSTHGTSEWFVLDALRRGYKVGITGGTDGVMGRPGACRPGWRLIRNLRNGLTAIYAEALTREALWEALQRRRCYATSGERIRLWVEVDGHMMGDEYQTPDNPSVSIAVEGTAPIERVDLWRGTEIICSWHLSPVSMRSDGWFRLLWGGTEQRGTARFQKVSWDGKLVVEGGGLLNVRSVNFQSPCDVFWREGIDTIAWRSATAGNQAGLLVEIQGDASTLCSFSSSPCTFTFRLAQVSLAPMTVDAGGVGRQVIVGPAPRSDGPREVALTYRDTKSMRGSCPYWVRVVQVDQERAWSSPVYVTRL